MAERNKYPVSVLIVDDEPTIVEQLSLLLSRRVESLHSAADGAEALECFIRENVDIIISDIDMPKMNGIELLKAVRQHDLKIPFILSTGLKSLDILTEAIEHGITAFLPKPFKKEDLLSKIETVAQAKKLEQEIADGKALLNQYKEIVDAATIVSKADTRGVITYVNEVFCKISGYSREELIGQSHSIVRDPQMPDAVFKELWETISAKKIWVGIIHNRAKDGSRYTVKSTIAPILDIQGNIIEFIALREDITPLQKAKDEATVAAKAKGDFLANMSHEIRTPMNGIIGFTSLLSQTALDPKQQKYLDIINNSTQTLLGIINDILDFSKIENGNMQLDLIAVNPQKEFKKISDLFTPKADEKKIELSVSVDPELSGNIYIDLLRMQQIVSNLLSNAIKFTPEEGVISFYVQMVDQADEHLTLRIGVKDSGIGISEASQAKIFEAFAQADSSITRRFGGTGLGLSISAQLVSLMGGKLQLQSQEGSGSDFYFDINVKTAVSEERSPQTSHYDDAINQADRFIGKVLVAEDNQINQILIDEYLKKYSLESMIVNNGKDALEKIEEGDYDLILMDINMPIMSGYEAIRILHEKKSAIPVVALTANAMEGDRERFIGYGFDDYLSKPVAEEELERVLKRYLQKKDQDDGQSCATSSPPKNILNLERITKEFPLSESLTHKLMKLFLVNTETAMSELKKAIAEKNFFQMEQTSHYIKGSVATLYLQSAVDITNEIESFSMMQQEADYEAMFSDLEKLMATVKHEILLLLATE